MSKPIFTPGPWHVFYDEMLDEYRCTIVDEKSFLISNVSRAAIRRGETYKEKQLANAYLIAAAPEMYAMLERIMDYRTGGPFIANPTKTEEIYNLLANARGEVRE